MREIKFRIFDRQRKKMHSFNLDNLNDGNFFIDDGEELASVSIDGKEIMQFTGLKDKNGREIFEGDIVKMDRVGIGKIVFMDEVTTDHELDIKTILPCFLIKWDEPPCSFIGKDDEERIEVIGNIYENLRTKTPLREVNL